nr:GDP-mannose 4,6-dehydratase [Actinomycetota bacterium]
FIGQALAGAPLTVAGDGQQTRSVCYVDDLVAGVLAVAGSGLSGPVNVGSPEEMSVLDIAHRIVAACDSASEIRFMDRAVDDPRVRRPDTSLIEAELQWRAKVSFADGIARTVEWFRRVSPVQVA